MELFKYVEPNRTYRAGEVIFKQGESAQEMYVVKEGKVTIFLEDKAEESVLEVIGPYGIFGEMALVDNSPRSASAVAQTDVALLAIDEEGFQKHVHTTPFFAIEVLRITVKRLRTFMQNQSQ